MYDDNFRNRHVETRERADGKLNIVVCFYLHPLGKEQQMLQEIVVHEKVGPKQAVKLMDRLNDALAGAYIQGRHNEKTLQHDPSHPIPETTAGR